VEGRAQGHVPQRRRGRRRDGRLIEPLRDVARKLGYALGVHGTLKRDIDLIACPWAWNAAPAKTLAKAIQHKAREIVGYAEPCRSDARSSNPKYFRDGLMGFAPKVGLIAAKPHGRKSWAFHLTPTRTALHRPVRNAAKAEGKTEPADAR
jgi:hypothetical protein